MAGSEHSYQLPQQTIALPLLGVVTCLPTFAQLLVGPTVC